MYNVHTILQYYNNDCQIIFRGGGGGGGGGGIGYQVSDITSTKCSFGYFSLDTPTPFAVLTVFLDNT